MAYPSYTEPVSNALRGAHSRGLPEPVNTHCQPGTPRSWPKSAPVPDMRMRVSDLRRLQESGLLPSPTGGLTMPSQVTGLNLKRVEHGKTSSWLFLGVGAQATGHQSPAHDEDDEVNGQTPLPRPTTSCHANPRALGLIRWLQEQDDPRFEMKIGPALQGFKLPPLQGTIIVLGVRDNSQRFAEGVQALVDKIKAMPCDDIPVVLLDFPVPGGRVAPQGVVKRGTDSKGSITVDQVDKARHEVYRLVAEIQLMLGKSGAKPHVSPIPGNLDGKDFVEFYTRWSQGVKDSALREEIVKRIANYDTALNAYTQITVQQFGQFATTINTRMREPAAQDEITLVPMPDLMARNLEMGDKASWISLRERPAFEAKSASAKSSEDRSQ